MENHPWRYDFRPTNYTLINFHVLINIIWQRTEKLNVQWGGADLARMDSNATDLDVRHVNVVGAYNEFRFSCLFPAGRLWASQNQKLRLHLPHSLVFTKCGGLTDRKYCQFLNSLSTESLSPQALASGKAQQSDPHSLINAEWCFRSSTRLEECTTS